MAFFNFGSDLHMDGQNELSVDFALPRNDLGGSEKAFIAV